MNDAIFSECDKKKVMDAMKQGIYEVLYQRGLLNGAQLDKLRKGSFKRNASYKG